jgi:hypothetical protein
MYNSREFVEAGGLIAYGASIPDLNRRTAIFADKILKGAKPSDLPVEQPTTFEFAINRNRRDTGHHRPADLARRGRLGRRLNLSGFRCWQILLQKSFRLRSAQH